MGTVCECIFILRVSHSTAAELSNVFLCICDDRMLYFLWRKLDVDNGEK